MITLETLTRKQRETLLKIARPDQRYLQACNRCDYICVNNVECNCCKAHGTRNPGGGVIYPDYANFGKDPEPQHYRICSMDELKASLATDGH